MIKTLTCAMVAAAAVALSASTSHAAPIGVVTNFDTITVSLTIRTNIDRVTGPNKVTRTSGMTRFVTKDLLNLLSGPDFAGMNFTNNAMLAFAWDLSPFGDHLVVIDKQGNVLYDVTANNSTNAGVDINFGFLLGATTGTANENTPGSQNFTAFNTGFFNIHDGTGTNTVLQLYGYGPSTERFSEARNGTNVVTSWSHNNTFNAQGADQTFNGVQGPATTSGTITARGSGKTDPYQLDIGNLGQ